LLEKELYDETITYHKLLLSVAAVPGSVRIRRCPSCSSFQIPQSYTFTDRFTFFYNQEGNLTQELFHFKRVGTLSNSVTGTSVPFHSAFTGTLTFATAGDFSTVTVTVTGQVYTVTLLGSGLILHDVGKVVFAPDGTITFEAGPHQLLDNQVQKLCAALA
jgi:hypothetical protein